MDILFKAKAINRDNGYYRSNYKNGDWVYGLITRLYDKRFENLPAQMIDENGISGIEIDHNTICRYIGLTDNTKWESLTKEEKQRFYNQVCLKESATKYTHIEDVKHLWKGKMIWENDIIKTDCGNVRVIYSAEPSPYENSFNVGFEVLFNNITDNENYRRDVGYWVCYRGFGVIGNIFDNPELLGV